MKWKWKFDTDSWFTFMSRNFFSDLINSLLKRKKLFFCCLSCRSAAKQKGSWVTAVLDHLLPPAGWTLRLLGGRLSETPLKVTSTFLSGTHFSAFCFIKSKYFRMCFSSQAVSHNSLIVSLNSSHFNMNQSLSPQRKTRSTRVIMSFKTFIWFDYKWFYYILKDKHHVFHFIFSCNISVIVFLELVFCFFLCMLHFKQKRSYFITYDSSFILVVTQVFQDAHCFI